MFPAIPDTDPPETRDASGRWHLGCMVTQSRAVSIARALFPDEIADGTDCRSETGREGEPCRVCAARNAAWSERVAQTRRAVIAAFSGA